MRVPYAKVDCSGNELKYVGEVLESGWLTTASKARLLEDQFATFVGCKHALAVNSCTSGLHLALEAIGVSRGDQVFVPSLTFTASAEVIRYLDADPVVLDVDLDTSCITPEILEKAILKYPNVKVLVAVHFGGMALQMTGNGGLIEICKKNNIRIVEDAAHALPTVLDGKYVGSFGDITCFSFYANKTMTTGEGGMVVTNSDQMAARIKVMRLHGIDRGIWDRFTSKDGAWEYDVVAPGFKYNLPDLNAAVGLAQFERLVAMHQRRVECAEYYYEHLSGIDSIALPARPTDIQEHSWHLFAIRVTEKSKLSRNEFISRLTEEGVGTSVHYKPLHRLKYYQSKYSLQTDSYHNSESIWQTTVSLPIYSLLSNEDIKFVCEKVRYLLS